MQAPDDPELGSLTVQQLLRLYSRILTELIERGVVRSRNAPPATWRNYLLRRPTAASSHLRQRRAGTFAWRIAPSCR